MKLGSLAKTRSPVPRRVGCLLAILIVASPRPLLLGKPNPHLSHFEQ